MSRRVKCALGTGLVLLLLTVASVSGACGSSASGSSFDYAGVWTYQHPSSTDTLTITANGAGFHAVWENDAAGVVMNFGDGSPTNGEMQFTSADESKQLMVGQDDNGPNLLDVDLRGAGTDQFETMGR